MQGQKHILNSAFCSNSTGLLSGAEPSNGPAGLSSTSSSISGTMSCPFQTCWASPSGSKAFVPPPVLLTGSNGLALSSRFQFKLLTANNTQLFRQLLRLSTFYLSCLIETIIILSPLSLHFAKQKQLCQPAQSTLCTLGGLNSFWTPQDQWVLSSFIHKQVKQENNSNIINPTEGRREKKIKN